METKVVFSLDKYDISDHHSTLVTSYFYHLLFTLLHRNQSPNRARVIYCLLTRKDQMPIFSHRKSKLKSTTTIQHVCVCRMHMHERENV